MQLASEGDASEQTRYCFDIYDLNSDGYISRKDCNFTFVHASVQFDLVAVGHVAWMETDFSLIVQGGDADNAEGEVDLNI